MFRNNLPFPLLSEHSIYQMNTHDAIPSRLANATSTHLPFFQNLTRQYYIRAAISPAARTTCDAT